MYSLNWRYNATTYPCDVELDDPAGVVVLGYGERRHVPRPTDAGPGAHNGGAPYQLYPGDVDQEGLGHLRV